MRLKGLIAFGVFALATGYLGPSVSADVIRQATRTLAGLSQPVDRVMFRDGSIGPSAREEIGTVGLEIGSIPAPPTPIPAPHPQSQPDVPGPLQLQALPSHRVPVAEPVAPPTPNPAPDRPPAPDRGFKVRQAISGTATSYCLTGTTATGTQAGPGAVAVDPSVIKLGSHVYVTGYGYGYATDTGSAIQGTLVDLWKTCDEAIQWGRRQVTIYVLES